MDIPDIKHSMEIIAGEICDKYCRWPDGYDVEKLGEDLAADLLFEQHCDRCPLAQFLGV